MRANPAMITLARESREWAQKDLAEAIGASQGQVSKYEHGILEAPRREIEAIGDQLDYDTELFYQRSSVFGLAGDFLYRRKASVSAKARRRVQAEANIFKMRVERLTQSAELVPAFPFPAIQPEECGGKPDRVAREVRRAWRIPDGAIANVTQVIERNGGIIFALDFGANGIDGTNIRVPGCPPLLFLDALAPGDRHRFNLAHELAHTVMHFAATLQDAEDEANAFASEFLMPKKQIASDLRNLDLAAAARLKQFWGVSMAALIRRARDLRVISEYSYRKLNMSLSAGGMRTREPIPIEYEQPETYERMVSYHRAQLEMSEDAMRTLLFTDELGAIERPKAPGRLGIVDDYDAPLFDG